MSKEFYYNYKYPAVPWEEVTRETGPLTYDDVLIKQGNDTEVESRSEVSLQVPFGSYLLDTPIVSAPMDTVTGEEMVRKLDELGGIGTLPRAQGMNKAHYYADLDYKLELCEDFSTNGVKCIYSVGLKNADEEARGYKERGAEVILIDIAHGGMHAVSIAASEIKNKYGLTVVAGNITTYEQAETYKKYGVDIARVGVGGGSVCTTREKTGVGLPQLSAIFETTESGIYVIADGGIKKPGDAAKAIAAGANAIMIGGLASGTDETPGEVIEKEDGQLVKIYRGQASKAYMQDQGIETNSHRTDEGIATEVPVKGSVSHVVEDISGGIRSSMSYVGAFNIQEFQERSKFVKITPATQLENQPHVHRK